jgi:hypothetical protein
MCNYQAIVIHVMRSLRSFFIAFLILIGVVFILIVVDHAVLLIVAIAVILSVVIVIAVTVAVVVMIVMMVGPLVCIQIPETEDERTAAREFADFA